MANEAEKCLICGNAKLKQYFSCTCWFIARYIFSGHPLPSRMFECNACGFRYFEKRFNDSEMDALYSQYRGENYYKSRHSCEPWYTRAINESTRKPELVNNIMQQIASALAPYKIKTILDYGGDCGQYIPPHYPGKYVYEVSAAISVNGVTRLSHDELKDKKFDCLICMNVIEHLSDPVSFIGSLAEYLSESGVLLLSVPYEYPKVSKFYTVFAKNVFWAYSHCLLFGMLIDIYSKIFKFKFDRVPPLGLLTQSEHINFFTKESLNELCGELYEPMSVRKMPNCGGIFAYSLVAVFKKSKNKSFI